MFEYYNNTLCVQANWLSKTGIISPNSLKVLLHRGNVKKARSARGLGNYALYVYDSLPQRFRNIIEHDLAIDPYEESRTIKFEDYLKYDDGDCAFFSDYLLSDGRFLREASLEAVNEYTANVAVFKAIKELREKIFTANPKFKKSELWSRFAKSIHRLPDDIKARYPFNLPKNARILRWKYEACMLKRPNTKYTKAGLEGLIHDNYCNNHSKKINEEVGGWLLATYCLPIKYTFSEMLTEYNKVRVEKGWCFLSESGITNYLMQPENERIWTEPRDGKDEYYKKYGHTLSKDKSRLFPNMHWAIDGTKLDAVHVWDNKAKMAASCKINVVIDVYSEKIIGYSFSMSETHIDHFIALKMAVNNAGERPYLFTYDAQSGHKSKRMQELYSKVVAKGGNHYNHKVGRKSNPIEQVFNRLQQQVINKRWFSDGQSIKSKQIRSKANWDFIHENKGALPTFDELEKHWELMVAEWNNMPRSKKATKTRNEFFEKEHKYSQKIGVLDRLSMFWIDETKPKKYYGHGMPLTVSGEDYLFEVYDENGDVDIDFRMKYVNEKLIVSYDPEYLDDYIALYRLNENEEKVFVSYAQTKRKYVEVSSLQKKGERQRMLKDLDVREEERERSWSQYLELAERTGITREALIDQQNAAVADSAEFNAKRAGFATKEENLASDSHSLFDKVNVIK